MILGIDIGGTTTKIGIVKNDKIINKFIIDTHPKTIIDDIIKKLKNKNIDIDDLHAIGAAMPGFIDHKKGIVTLSGNLGYKDYEFKKEFEIKINRPVYVVNDANAAALGEYWVGAGKDYNSTILYTLGTGVGGGVVLKNELVFGSHGYAGELGHGGFFQDKRKCNCGLDNCIEPMSSAVGITKSLKEEFGDDRSLIDAEKDFIKKETRTIKAFTEALTPLAQHIAVMETAFNPEAIIIGGGPSNYGQSLADFIQGLVSKYQLNFITDSTPIVIATTKNDAGILGAAYWALTNKAKEQ